MTKKRFLGHLSNSDNILSTPWAEVRRRPSSIVSPASSVNVFFSRTTGPIFTLYQIWYVASVR